METNLADVYAAGDCVETWHRLLERPAYLPLGTTAHKQGRVAGENAVGGKALFAGSLATQVVKVFELAIAGTGLTETAARQEGFDVLTVELRVPDHKAYYPGAHDLRLRITGDRESGRLLGAQILGHWQAEVAKRIDIFATALFHGMLVDQLNELDLSYTPPMSSPWDPVQLAAQAWATARRRSAGAGWRRAVCARRCRHARDVYSVTGPRGDAEPAPRPWSDRPIVDPVKEGRKRMGPTAWRQFLGRWNRELLGDAEVRRGLPAEVVASGWLGYPGATPAEIERAESRLGVRLPPSYRTFLTVSNGWHPAAPYLGRLWSTEEIGWYAGRHGRAIVEYLAGAACEPAARVSSGAAPQDARFSAADFLWSALEISDANGGDDAVMLLSPDPSSRDAGWATAFLTTFSDQIDRYGGFQELMLARYACYRSLPRLFASPDPAMMDPDLVARPRRVRQPQAIRPRYGGLAPDTPAAADIG